MQDPDAVIVGAGPAVLACAVTMRAAGLDVIVLEKADSVGSQLREIGLEAQRIAISARSYMATLHGFPAR